ncbi:MAG: protein phosphatase 2C domain-containing protein [Myxococcales bacterium]|nr:protein phosphatase 2C domain-containing protein [Myxococcales bacterium]
MTDTDQGIRSKIWIDANMETPHCETIPAGEIAVFSMRCPGHEGANEDSVMALSTADGRAVFAVADGAGGMPSGEEASKLALQSLQKNAQKAHREGTQFRAGILDGFEAGNQAIIDLGVGAATTMAVVEVEDGRLRTYHAGDSMTLVTGQRGKCKLLTVPHSPVGYAVEAGLLHQKEALFHEDLNQVSNIVGMADMRVELGPSTQMSKHDTLVLGSDGLFDNLHIDEIIETIRKGPIPGAAAALANAARQRMTGADKESPSKADDLTFIVFRRK